MDPEAASEIRPLQRTEIIEGARALARSLEGYALYDYFFHQPASRPAQLGAFMEGFVDLLMDYGHVYCGRSPADGVAMFLPPGVDTISMRKMIPAVLRSVRRTGLSYLSRALPVSEELDRKRPREPHWYVVLIGVSPSAQGRGLGRRLMRHVLGKADAAAQPVYLETTARRNLDFYGAMRFQREEEFHCHKGRGPLTWSMLRRPTAPQGERAHD